MPNYELGKSMVADASRVVTEVGAKILGTVTYAFPGTSDFSSVLLQAQSSGAKVICFANAGEDLTNSLKQAREFGFGGSGLVLAVPFMGEPTIQSLGLAAAGGGYFPAPDDDGSPVGPEPGLESGGAYSSTFSITAGRPRGRSWRS